LTYREQRSILTREVQTFQTIRKIGIFKELFICIICKEWSLGRLTTEEARSNFREYIIDDSEIHLHKLFEALGEEVEEQKDE
jgi:thermostable 8-oxoguanine DNA glycosylase